MIENKLKAKHGLAAKKVSILHFVAWKRFVDAKLNKMAQGSEAGDLKREWTAAELQLLEVNTRQTCMTRDRARVPHFL